MKKQKTPESVGQIPATLRGAPARVRDKERTYAELRSALQGMKSEGVKVSVVAVAKLVGVHPSLIHKVYPEIAEEIGQIRRGSLGSSKEVRQENKFSQAMRELSEVRAKLLESELLIKSLISKNATLDHRVRSLEASLNSGAGNVIPLKDKSKRPPV